MRVAVIGIGAMGSMALWRLAQRGIDVTGFELHEPGHALGSSHGESRLIRTAYHEGPEYVPLVQESWRLWRELETQTGRDLVTRCGGLLLGPPDGEVVSGALASARLHSLDHRLLDTADLARRHPQHVVTGGVVGVEEPDAGFVRPEAAVRAAATAAVSLGARFHTNCRVLAVEPNALGATVVTDTTTAHFDHVIVCAGPWTPTLLAWAELPLQVERQTMGWFGIDEPAPFQPARFPVWIREVDGHFIYGVPTLDGHTVKAAIHHDGVTVDPDTVERETSAGDVALITSSVGPLLRGLSAQPVEMRVCMYTNSPDLDFVLGPVAPNVTVISACSGHGFKFAPVIGDIAADLAVSGESRRVISRFVASRFTDPPA